jgi:murein DD-endopeptidase MepM/ murein hydrolase activator NlpD
MPAEAQVCIKSENFSLVVASTNGIALRSATRLDARTSETVAFQQTVDFDGWTYGETITDLWGSKDALWFRLRGRDRWVPSGYMRGFPPSKPSPTSGATPTCSDNTSNPQDFRPVNFSGRAYVGGANIRSATSLSASIVRRAQSEERLNFDGWTYGERVRDEASGQLDARWYRLSGQNLWVASAVVNGNAPGSTPLPPESPQTGQISLPFASGQTWYVCQGYNGTVSHRGYPALDLTVAKDFGSNNANACWASDGNVDKSKGQSILAPAAGKVLYISGRPDLICLQLDDRRSLMIGHMRRSVEDNQSVSAGTQLGTVAPSTDANVGGYAHIHIEARKSSSCAKGTAVPFTSAEGFQFNGIGDLPGDQTHFKRELRR